MNNIIAGKEFKQGEEFSHSGGTWMVRDVYPEFNCIDISPTFGTRIKPQIVGRVFKIKGIWFKVTEQGQTFITLTVKLEIKS